MRINPAIKNLQQNSAQKLWEILRRCMYPAWAWKKYLRWISCQAFLIPISARNNQSPQSYRGDFPGVSVGHKQCKTSPWTLLALGPNPAKWWCLLAFLKASVSPDNSTLGLGCSAAGRGSHVRFLWDGSVTSPCSRHLGWQDEGCSLRRLQLCHVTAT